MMREDEEGLEIWFKRLCQKYLVFDPLPFDYSPPKRKPEERFKNMSISIPYNPTYIFVPCVN